MFVILSNGFLGTRTGSETVMVELARHLADRGHRVAAFVPGIHQTVLDGRRPIPVFGDPGRIADRPDVIHAQHATSLLPLWRRFPDVPIVQSVQDVNHPLDEPIRLGGVRAYVAVDDLRAQRMRDAGVPDDRIAIVPNAVDLGRFRPRPPHARIVRALVVAKYHPFLGKMVRAALPDVQVDVLEKPDFDGDFADRLRGYDLLVGSGRCALEAAAVGLSVVVCDERGFAGPLTSRNWRTMRAGNFGAAAFRGDCSVHRIADAVADLDPADAVRVAALVREEGGPDTAIRVLEDLFRRVVAEGPAAAPSDPAGDLVEYAVRLQGRLRRDSVPADIARARQVMAGLESAGAPTPEPPPARMAVVVMAVGAPPTMVDAVRSLVSQSVRPEVVVVNSGGGDAAARLREAGLDAKVVESDRLLLPGATRNRGLGAVSQRYVAFLASDCVAEPEWVANRIAAHGAGARIVASSLVCDRPWHPVAVASHVALFGRRLPTTPKGEASLYGASYDRTLFRELGFFDEGLRIGEDSEFHARAAGTARPVWTPAVRTVHRTSGGVVALVRDQFVRGRRAGRALAQSQNRLGWPSLRAILVRRYRETSSAFDGYRAVAQPIAPWLVRPLILLAQASYVLGVRAGNRAARRARTPGVPTPV